MMDMMQTALASVQMSPTGNLIIALLSAFVGALVIVLTVLVGEHIRLVRSHNRKEHIHLEYKHIPRENTQEKKSAERKRGKKKQKSNLSNGDGV